MKSGAPGVYSYGSCLNRPPPALLSLFPKCVHGFKLLHNVRVSSFTTHPRKKHGGQTRRLKHRDFRKLVPPISNALGELETEL
jgi:hypothetical protein